MKQTFLCFFSVSIACMAEVWPLESLTESLIVHGAAENAVGASSQSLQLDGSSLVELKDTARLASGSFTVSLWFNL